MRMLSQPENYRDFEIRLEPDFTVNFSEGLCCWPAASFGAARARIDLIHAERAVLRRRQASQYRGDAGHGVCDPADVVGSRAGRTRR